MRILPFVVLSIAWFPSACTRVPFAEDVRGGRNAPTGPVADAPRASNDRDLDVRGGGVRILQSATGTVCGDDLAATTFRFAACLCDDASFAGRVETSSYSSSDPTAPVAGGGLGANGSIGAAGDLDIGGTLAAGGSVQPAGGLVVRDDLRAGGDVAFAGEGDVGGDAYVGGDVTAIGLSVGGVLHVNDGAMVLAGLDGDAPEVVRESVSIDPPCACGDDQRTDVVGIVAQARTDNDNAAHGIDAASLADVAGDVELSLPGGRFLFDGVRAAGAVRIAVTGPTAMFVDGDVAFAGELEVLLEGPDASLDLFVNGDLAAAGAFDVGSATAPSRVRIYVGGEGDIAIAGEAGLGASLFAPDARVALAGSFVFDGALVARDIAAAGELVVRYDADVVEGAGEGCEEPGVDGDVPAGDAPADGTEDGAGGDDGAVDDGAPADGPAEDGAANDDLPVDGDAGADGEQSCLTAADCGNQACVDGICGACAGDLDCPAPLVCIEGGCAYISG